MAGTNLDSQDKINRERYGSGIEYLKELDDLTRVIQDRMLRNLPSNYPKDLNTNLAGLYRAIAEELARLQMDSSQLNDDRYFKFTRTEYLFQILGDLLFLGEKSINEDLNDVEYRDFLLKVKKAYMGGSRADNIQSALSDILSLPIELKEVYQSLRIKNTYYTLKDTHKMFFEISMDHAKSSNNIGLLLSDIKFFIDLIKPAHTLYQTRLVWTENADLRGDCTPKYDTVPMDEVVYYASKVYQVTYFLTLVYKTEVESGEEGWSTGIISDIDYDAKIIYTEDNRTLPYGSETVFFRRDSLGEDSVISYAMFSVGDEIKYFFVEDSSGTSDLIEEDWSFSNTIESVNLSEETVAFEDGSKLVYNTDTTIYTRDGDGEYRIFPEDLLPGRTLIFKGKRYTEAFQFFNLPNEVSNNYYKQFDQNVIDRPFFQENVKKLKDIRPGFDEGPNVIVENGEVKVIDVRSRFYDREGASSQKEVTLYRYSLFINGVYKAQFTIQPPLPELTETQAKNIFVVEYGFHEILDPLVEYEIKVSETGKMEASSEGASVEAINGKTQLCDRRASCSLNPYYEDTRNYWAWPDLHLTSGFIVLYQDWDPENAQGEQNLPGAYAISSDPNEYVMPLLPVLNSSGSPAEPEDLVVYVNGLVVEDAVETLDPWTGALSLNFIPPFNSVVRVDYQHSERYPKPTSCMKEVRTHIKTHSENDLGGEYSILSASGLTCGLSWPFHVTDPVLKGDNLDHQVNKFPILTQSGNLASTDDINVSVGQTLFYEDVQVVIGSDYISNASGSWGGAQEGDTIILEVKNYLDNTLAYSVGSVESQSLLRMSKTFPALELSDLSIKCRIVRFVEVPDSVESVRPLLGHVRINFLPPSGSFLRFSYYYTHYNRNYALLPDSLSGYGSDVVFNSYHPYTLLVDQSPLQDLSAPIVAGETPLKIGYRYRAFGLSGSAVLNSSDTLSLNSFSKPSKKGSFKNNRGNTNQHNLVFSSEYLTDTDKDLVLNDKYLEKNIEASTQLYKGTPLFIETFTDDGHHIKRLQGGSDNTYAGETSSGDDLSAGFNVNDPDKSGDIDYKGVCDYSKNGNARLYSDLVIKKFYNGGSDVPLGSISEGSRSFPIKTLMIDQYFPNRELRISDYLDFINKVPENIRTGAVRVLNGSRIVKCPNRDAHWFSRGDSLVIKQVPVIKWDSESSQNVTVYKDLKYTVVKIVDVETAEIHANFSGKSGHYEYEFSHDFVMDVDTLLAGDEDSGSQKYGVLQRRLVLNGGSGFSYSIPSSILKHLPSPYELSFTDPDTDPYPRNPNNPDINGVPTGDPEVLFTDYTGQPTKVPLSSEVIDSDGYNILGSLSTAGLTGPSGAVDLGLTGPSFSVTGGIEDINSRYLHGFENPKYNIPGGYTGIYASYSEAEYRVKWRNWDQDMMIVSLKDPGAPDGVMQEEPINMLDDLAEGIRISYWNVFSGSLEHKYYFGTVLDTSRALQGSVDKNLFIDGLIKLSKEQALNIEDAIAQSLNPVTEYPEYRLNDDLYELRENILHEVLYDNSLKVTEIREFKPI